LDRRNNSNENNNDYRFIHHRVALLVVWRAFKSVHCIEKIHFQVSFDACSCASTDHSERS